jgi:hypothetical protein
MTNLLRGVIWGHAQIRTEDIPLNYLSRYLYAKICILSFGPPVFALNCSVRKIKGEQVTTFRLNKRNTKEMRRQKGRRLKIRMQVRK